MQQAEQRFLTCAYQGKSSSKLPLFNEKRWFLGIFWSELPSFLVVTPLSLNYLYFVSCLKVLQILIFLMKFSYTNFVIRCLMFISNCFLKFQCIIANFVECCKYMVLVYVECQKNCYMLNVEKYNC